MLQFLRMKISFFCETAFLTIRPKRKKKSFFYEHIHNINKKNLQQQQQQQIRELNNRIKTPHLYMHFLEVKKFSFRRTILHFARIFFFLFLFSSTVSHTLKSL